MLYRVKNKTFSTPFFFSAKPGSGFGDFLIGQVVVGAGTPAPTMMQRTPYSGLELLTNPQVDDNELFENTNITEQHRSSPNSTKSATSGGDQVGKSTKARRVVSSNGNTGELAF